MTKPVILVAEDEVNLLETLALNLRMEGYDVIAARTGSEAIRQFDTHASEISLALLDVMLPDADGFTICTHIKAATADMPVIFLTARDQKHDRLSGLRLGADDYISKPFDLEELMLRIANKLRRYASPVYTFAHGSVNFETFEVTTFDGKKQTLSKREIGLLKLLTSTPEKVISRDEIIDSLWLPHENPSSRTIDNYILGFRKLFEPDPKNPVHFHSIRGVGYKFHQKGSAGGA
jgi:two-component system, OmpR family, alkaline phosphatase synthesis response regulator PhoP